MNKEIFIGVLVMTLDLDIYGLVATPEAYHMRQTRAQEGFGVGDFEAEVSIRSKEGGYCRCILLIHIERQ